MSDKWRPSLALVIGGMLATVLILPAAGYVIARLHDGQGWPEWSSLSQAAVAAAGAVVVATILIAFVSVRAIAGPIHDLRVRTARIASGDLDAMQPLAHSGTRETAELSAAFLDMARKLQTRSDIVRSFATHVSHELKTPLTSILGATELLQDGGEQMDAAARHRFHANIAADAERMNRLVHRLIELARAENAGISGQTCSLSEAVEQMPPQPIPVVIEAGAQMCMAMSAQHLSDALAHLADNAARHGATGVGMTAEVRDDRIALTVSDDGRGIAPDHRDRIFEPFFTTRRASGGTGLGLGIVVALLRSHGGTIRLVPSERGARFEIDLPSPQA